MKHNSPTIFVFFGMIATGKSTLAKMWAKAHKMFYYNSDVIRKEIAGNASRESGKSSFGKGIYSTNYSQKTYDLLLEKTKIAITNQHSIVLDASYSSKSNRQQIIDLAVNYNVSVCFIYCSCAEDKMRQRMEKRAQDPVAISDGRWEIYQQQKDAFEHPTELGDKLITIDTSDTPEQLLAELQSRIRAL
jgi:uncharacterized protein